MIGDIRSAGRTIERRHETPDDKGREAVGKGVSRHRAVEPKRSHEKMPSKPQERHIVTELVESFINEENLKLLQNLRRTNNLKDAWKLRYRSVVRSLARHQRREDFLIQELRRVSIIANQRKSIISKLDCVTREYLINDAVRREAWRQYVTYDDQGFIDQCEIRDRSGTLSDYIPIARLFDQETEEEEDIEDLAEIQNQIHEEMDPEAEESDAPTLITEEDLRDIDRWLEDE